ncbi:unnamed protein product [Arctia plantaginis]|uniref:Uncharacterized protein n=1 Tax=Arctia plantaginis TaxID=874455 RepID=A0A8S0YZX5_ARCPL|nr:unnamed protein product [Arctia plantaginis]
MKILGLLVFIGLGVCCYTQSHDLMLGQPNYGDLPVYRFDQCKYGFPLITRSSIIEYPGGQLSNIPYITAIYVKDNLEDGSGGYASLLEGGVGQRFVKIKLKSQQGGGFNFTVTIYGRFL